MRRRVRPGSDRWIASAARAIALGVASCAGIGATPAAGQSLDGIGVLLGASSSYPLAMARDGTRLVGECDGGTRAFTWRAGEGIGELSAPVATSVIAATDCSGNGSIIVGYYSPSPGARGAFRFTDAGGFQDLGTLPGDNYARAFGISGDGSVIVGESGIQPGSARVAFRWTVAGMAPLGTLPGQATSVATDISEDAAVIVGNSGARAFRWTTQGMADLGVLPAQSYAQAAAVSDDGTTIVGASGPKAFRWTAAGGMVEIPGLPGSVLTFATDVSGDGTTAVGVSIIGSASRAWIWTPGGGTRSLHDALAGLGVALHGWTLEYASAISRDGRTIAGQGATEYIPEFFREEGFVATLGASCVADYDDGSGTGTPDQGVDINDLLYYLVLFDAGDIRADVDDGSGTNTRDQGVDINDLLYFLVRFDAGC